MPSLMMMMITDVDPDEPFMVGSDDDFSDLDGEELDDNDDDGLHILLASSQLSSMCHSSTRLST